MRSLIAAGVPVCFGPLLWQGSDDCLLPGDCSAQRVHFFAQFRGQLLPLAPIAMNYRKEKFRCRTAHVGREIRTPQMLQQNMQQVEIGIPQMDRRPLVAVKVEQRRGIAGAFVLEIERV